MNSMKMISGCITQDCNSVQVMADDHNRNRFMMLWLDYLRPSRVGFANECYAHYPPFMITFRAVGVEAITPYLAFQHQCGAELSK